MKIKLATTAAFVTLALIAGSLRAFAQTSSFSTPPIQTQAVDIPEQGEVADAAGQTDTLEKGDVLDTQEAFEAGEGTGPDTDNVQDVPQ